MTREFDVLPMRVNVLIVGAGFAGVNAARVMERRLRHRDDLSVALINRDNFQLFTPLLAEVASSQVESRHALTPLRRMLDRVQFFQGTVYQIDPHSSHLYFVNENGQEHVLQYDHCVLAAGSETAYFGIEGLADEAFSMKSIGDAIAIRNHILMTLERAQVLPKNERAGLLTFMVGGGGLNGIEVAGEIHDFVLRAARDYPIIDESEIRVVLVEMTGRLARELPERLGAYARRDLERRGIEIWLNAKMTACQSGVVRIEDERALHTDTAIWTAGVRPSPLTEQIPVRHEQGDSRLPTNSFLQVKGFDNLWAVGDCALITDSKDGSIHPPTAQHAVRQGRRVAQNVWSVIHGSDPQPVKYSGRGMLASLGRRRGVGQVLGIRLTGFPAWFAWRTYYLLALPRWERRARVALDWTLDLLFERDIVQLMPARRREPTESGSREEEVRAV